MAGTGKITLSSSGWVRATGVMLALAEDALAIINEYQGRKSKII